MGTPSFVVDWAEVQKPTFSTPGTEVGAVMWELVP